MGKVYDLTGQKYGMLTVIEEAENQFSPSGYLKRMWKCRCDCGNEVIAIQTYLLHCQSGMPNCGCYTKKKIKERSTTHGGSVKGHWDRLYGIYAGMKARCFNKNRTQHKRYGARGITICDEWLGKNGYANFRTWAYANGYDANAKKGQCTIDRIDVNGDYEPSNCRWITNAEQARNKRTNRILTYNGESHPMCVWAEKIGIKEDTIQARIDYHGWSVEEALTLPLYSKRKQGKQNAG